MSIWLFGIRQCVKIHHLENGGFCKRRRFFGSYREPEHWKKKPSPSDRKKHLLAELKSCAISKDFERGKQVHAACVEGSIHNDVRVATSLVKMYAKCGSMEDARKVFDSICSPDVVSWTALIFGYAGNGEGEQALSLFEQMQRKGIEPDARLFLGALLACATAADKEEAKQVDGKLVKMKCLEKGMRIHSQIVGNKGCSFMDIFVASALVDMYVRCGSMVDASAVFDRMPQHDVISWNLLLSGYVEKRENEIALKLLERMKIEGCYKNERTFVLGLMVCGDLTAFEVGRALHSEIELSRTDDAYVTACLVDFYAKCGRMEDARQVFDSSRTRDLALWTALMTGYSRQGNSEQVFRLFERMQEVGIQADGIVFLTILTACSHVGLVHKGKEYFEQMVSKHRVSPLIDHYHCMIDVLGRANQIDEAVTMAKVMPFEPEVVTWRIILSACKKWKSVAVGKLAFDNLVRLDVQHSAGYMLMANIYASAGLWEEEANILAMKSNLRVVKACTALSWWIDSQGNVHKFRVGEMKHPQNFEIHAKLEEINVRIKQHEGYVADLGSVFCNITDFAKENSLNQHSERLAITCALINSPPGTTIRIAKNLRACEDCHQVTAIISKMEQRTIICRDATRFHTFKDGKCSCGDFW